MEPFRKAIILKMAIQDFHGISQYMFIYQIFMNRLPNLCGILRAKVVLTMNIVDIGQNKGQITDKPLFCKK